MMLLLLVTFFWGSKDNPPNLGLNPTKIYAKHQLDCCLLILVSFSLHFNDPLGWTLPVWKEKRNIFSMEGRSGVHKIWLLACALIRESIYLMLPLPCFCSRYGHSSIIKVCFLYLPYKYSKTSITAKSYTSYTSITTIIMEIGLLTLMLHISVRWILKVLFTSYPLC